MATISDYPYTCKSEKGIGGETNHKTVRSAVEHALVHNRDDLVVVDCNGSMWWLDHNRNPYKVDRGEAK